MRNSEADRITVNSSPYAVPVYHKLGFSDTDTEQLADGMRYTLMKFEKIIRKVIASNGENLN